MSSTKPHSDQYDLDPILRPARIVDVVAILAAVALSYLHVAAAVRKSQLGIQFNCREVVSSSPFGIAQDDLQLTLIGIIVAVVAYLLGREVGKRTWWIIFAAAILSFALLSASGVMHDLYFRDPYLGLVIATPVLGFPCLMWCVGAQRLQPRCLRKIRIAAGKRWRSMGAKDARKDTSKIRRFAWRHSRTMLMAAAIPLGCYSTVIFGVGETHVPLEPIGIHLDGPSGGRVVALLRSDTAGLIVVDQDDQIEWVSRSAIATIAPAEFKLTEGSTFNRMVAEHNRDVFPMILALYVLFGIGFIGAIVAGIFKLCSTGNRKKPA